MLDRLFSLLAQTTAPVANPTAVPSVSQPIITTTTAVPPGVVTDMPWYARLLSQGGMLIPLSLILIIFYFIVFRQKQKQDKEKKDLLDNVKKGDTIETIGGLLGTVVSSDPNTVVVKVDETANVKLKFNRRAIHRVIVEDEKK